MVGFRSSLENWKSIRTKLHERGLIPSLFLESTVVQFSNFKVTKRKVFILLPKGPGRQKWIATHSLPDCEVEYHLNKLDEELSLEHS